MTITLNSPLISTDWLSEHLENDSLRILDCSMVVKHFDDGSYGFVSGRDEWEKNHISNSIYVDVGSELSDQDHVFTLMMPAAEQLAETLRRKGVGDGTAVICYDRSNHAWAARVWWMLRTCGFDNAAVLDGGWKKWCAEDREQSTQACVYPPAENFTVNVRPDLMVDKQEVQTACADAQTLLLNSLPHPVFTGRISPYQRAGRIPGSCNLYCEALLDTQTNTFMNKTDIEEKMAAVGAMQASRVITYCGGGIAASANALALTLLGHDNVAVYDGSLTEWTADPELPMETG